MNDRARFLKRLSVPRKGHEEQQPGACDQFAESLQCDGSPARSPFLHLISVGRCADKKQRRGGQSDDRRSIVEVVKVTTEEALKDYLEAREMIPRELPRDEWYRENWVRVAMWGRRIPVFPVYGFKESLFIHDIHHLLSGYDTDWTGELEIAAWELSSGGCGRYLLYWIDRMVFTLLGLIFAPRATCRAFRRGLKHQNIFHRKPEEVMSIEIDELRRMTLSPDSTREGRRSGFHDARQP